MTLICKIPSAAKFDLRSGSPRQLVRLWRLLGETAVGPILDLFDERFPEALKRLRPAEQTGVGG